MVSKSCLCCHKQLHACSIGAAHLNVQHADAVPALTLAVRDWEWCTTRAWVPLILLASTANNYASVRLGWLVWVHGMGWDVGFIQF
jgi:hypothetical protein